MSEGPGENIPLEKQIPLVSIASPSEIKPRIAADVRWYKPGLAQTMKLMGWRWVFFIPAAAMLVLFATSPGFWMMQFFIWWKLILMAIAFPLSYGMKISKNLIRDRKEPFCIHCGYDLSGLPDEHACPECGEMYKFSLIEEYRRDPQWFIQRYHHSREIPAPQAPFNAGPIRRKRSRDGT